MNKWRLLKYESVVFAKKENRLLFVKLKILIAKQYPSIKYRINSYTN